MSFYHYEYFLVVLQLSSRDHVTCLTVSSSIRLGMAPWLAWAAVIVQQVTCRRQHGNMGTVM